MSIINVYLDESENECISCYLCAEIAPRVFEITDKMQVKEYVDLDEFEAEIREAKETCPTQVIAVEMDLNIKLKKSKLV
jgi:ferredoxin